MKSKRWRRKARTAILGVVAFIALIWGAIDIVGVPAENLWRVLGQVSVGLVALILLASTPLLVKLAIRKLKSSRGSL